MKKFIMTFWVASLMIISVWSLSSCKKTDTNASAKEWIPTTIDFVGKDSGLSGAVEDAFCPYDSIIVNYCNHSIRWWSYDEHGQTIICPEGAWDPDNNPNGHYHQHYFTANDDCTPPNNPNYFCPNLGRNHKHLVVYWHEEWKAGWHVGGSLSGQ